MKLPKVINEDVIERIAEYAERNYSKSATARELNLDRTTVRKYWPREQKAEEEKGKQPTPELSLEEEFRLLSKKAEIDYELESMLNKIKDWKWETEDLRAKGKAAVVGIDFLRQKLDKAESVTEVIKVCALVNEVRNNVTALLDENEPIRKQRQEREVKKEESLMRARLNELAWIFPCRRDQAEKILNGLVSKDVYGDTDRIRALHRVGLLLIVAEDIEWGDNIRDLKPLITDCANLLKGNWNETERIIGVLYERKKRILIPSDEDMEKKYLHTLELLTLEVNEHSVEMVLKFNAALGRLADERFIEKEDLLNKEATAEPVIG